MTPPMVPQASRTRHHATPATVTRLIPRAASRVDELFKLRQLIRDAQTAERAATRELVELMQSQGFQGLQGTAAVAVLDLRDCLQVDVPLFLEAAGSRAPEALSVRVEAARRLLGDETLRAIAETTTNPVLRVEPLTPSPTAA